ncbi:MAG TPA: hypothetical protein VKR58_06020 [Aquella sp.]|nr:hypothetical protein [Aquella sp.]
MSVQEVIDNLLKVEDKTKDIIVCVKRHFPHEEESFNITKITSDWVYVELYCGFE